jgi:hypothetical protein
LKVSSEPFVAERRRAGEAVALAGVSVAVGVAARFLEGDFVRAVPLDCRLGGDLVAVARGAGDLRVEPIRIDPSYTPGPRDIPHTHTKLVNYVVP